MKINILALFFSLILTGCFEELEYIESPTINTWTHSVASQGIVSINDTNVQMGQEIGGLNEFSKNFEASNLKSYSKTMLSINFTEVQILLKTVDPSFDPQLYINGAKIGSILKNSSAPNTNSCWVDVGGGFKYYTCTFALSIDIKNYLKDGNNSLKISNSNGFQMYMLGKATVEFK